MDIYRDNMWQKAKLSDLGRADWHHNSEGQIDYFPMYSDKSTRREIPVERQRYDFTYEDNRERGASNLTAYQASKPDWREYNRIMNEFN